MVLTASHQPLATPTPPSAPTSTTSLLTPTTTPSTPLPPSLAVPLPPPFGQQQQQRVLFSGAAPSRFGSAGAEEEDGELGLEAWWLSPREESSNTGGLKRRSSRSKRNALGGAASGELENRNRRVKRQGPTAEGYPDCNNVGNYVLSCFPEDNTTLTQDVWSKFIWNARYPTFIGTGAVDVYLYRADSETVVESFLSVDNDRGMIAIEPNDDWWGVQTTWTEGRNRTFPYFFVVVDANTTITGGEQHQNTFSAVQTAPPATLASSLSSRSSVSSASVASRSSLSVASVLSASISSASAAARTSAANGGSSLQNNSSGGAGTKIPAWAIAVIVVLGVLALVTAGLAYYFCMGRLRRDREKEARREEEELVRAGSRNGGGVGGDGDSSAKGSREPFMAGLAGGAGVLGGGMAGGLRRDSEASRRPTTAGTTTNDTSYSDAGGAGGGRDGGGGPITGSDAAVMAEAFRKALRRPEFDPTDEGAGQDEEDGGGDSPEGADALMDQELKSEGRSLRNVSGGRRWGQQG